MDKGSNETNSTITKKPEAAQQKDKKENKKEKKESGIISYFRGVNLEMKKVVWPTQKELGSYTVVVLATCVAFALLFWGVDTGVLAAIKAVCF